MKIEYSEKEQKFKFKLDDNDFYEAFQIEEMINGIFKCRKCGCDFESKGWKILQGYFESSRELLIEAGKDGTRTRAKRELSDIKFAKIDGFDYAVDLPQRIVNQARSAKEAKETKETINDARNEY